LRHDEGTKEADDVIDAERAPVTHRLAEEVPPRLDAALAQRERVPRRKGPYLSLAREGVGRRAEADAEREETRIGPRVGRVHRAPHGEVLVQPDPHPGGLGALLHPAELAVELELDEALEVDLL